MLTPNASRMRAALTIELENLRNEGRKVAADAVAAFIFDATPQSMERLFTLVMLPSARERAAEIVSLSSPVMPVVCPDCLKPLEGPFAGCVCGQSDDLGSPSPNGHKFRTRERVEIHGSSEGYGHNGIVTGYFHNGGLDALAYSVELTTGPRRGRSLLVAEADLKPE